MLYLRVRHNQMIWSSTSHFRLWLKKKRWWLHRRTCYIKASALQHHLYVLQHINHLCITKYAFKEIIAVKGFCSLFQNDAWDQSEFKGECMVMTGHHIFFHNSHYSILIVLPYHFLRIIVLLTYVLYLRQCAVNEIEFENIHYHYNGS